MTDPTVNPTLHKESGEMIDRINHNTLRILDNHMQDVADGKADLETPVLRVAVDVLKINRDIIADRRNVADRITRMQDLVDGMPDNFPGD